MIKRKAYLFILIAIITALFACSNTSNNKTVIVESPETIYVVSGIFVGSGYGTYGEALHNGLLKALKLHPIIKLFPLPGIIEGTPKNEKEMLLKKIHFNFNSKAKYAVIMWRHALMIEDYRKYMPGLKFIIIDSTIEKPNSISISVSEHEGSFMAGAFASIFSKSSKIGFIGGEDFPLIRKFELGFIQGALHVNKNITIFSNYSGSFHGYSAGFTLAEKMYLSGVDIIFHASGETGQGIIAAGKKYRKFVIGVDTDERPTAPGTVLTSMEKSFDNVLPDVFRRIKEEDFNKSHYEYGLKECGVKLTPFREEDNISQIITNKLKDIKQKIIKGDIKVLNYLDKSDRNLSIDYFRKAIKVK